MSNWKRLLSYLLPIKEHELESPISGPLEICWENGHLALNSGQANYSYNHLEQVFKGAMKKAGLAHRQVDRVLNLGMGAGSTVKLLRKDFGKDPYIRSIEMDPLIIELAERYFSIGEDGKHDILCTEALSYVQECMDTFDLILVDLFIDNVHLHFRLIPLCENLRTKGQKSGRDQLFMSRLCIAIQKITGDLFLNEFVEWLVRVERSDYVITIPPGISMSDVFIETV